MIYSSPRFRPTDNRGGGVAQNDTMDGLAFEKQPALLGSVADGEPVWA